MSCFAISSQISVIFLSLVIIWLSPTTISNYQLELEFMEWSSDEKKNISHSHRNDVCWSEEAVKISLYSFSTYSYKIIFNCLVFIISVNYQINLIWNSKNSRVQNSKYNIQNETDAFNNQTDSIITWYSMNIESNE